MTRSGPDDAVASAFEEQRERLVAVAHRILGSRADAEDAVQEAWLRLTRQDTAGIDNFPGWLTTVVGRICIDALRVRGSRPKDSYEDRLAEWIVTEDVGVAPEDDALLAESVGLALLVVLDTLSPAERLAFVLHDMFAVPFDDIGQIIGRSADASKMLASRARHKVSGTDRARKEPRRQRQVVDAFLAAARTGDFAGLLRVLDPDVTWHGHTAHGVVVKLGATEVAARAQHASRAKVTAHPVLINGHPGIVARAANGTAVAVMACAVINGRIVAITSVTDAAHLASMTLPAPSGSTDRTRPPAPSTPASPDPLRDMNP